MEVMTKALAVAYETKVINAKDGVVSAIVSVTANRDEGGDVILPGALKWGLDAGITPKGVVAHDWSRTAAKAIEVVELLPGDASLPPSLLAKGLGGMRVKAQFNLNTTTGKDAFADVEFYEDAQEWSIGYAGFGAYVAGPGVNEKAWESVKALLPASTIKSIEEAHGASRFLPQVKTYEFSTVLFGMNSETVTESVKDAQLANLDQIVADAVAREVAKIKIIGGDTHVHNAPATRLEVKLWIEDDALEGSAEAFIDAVQDAAQAWMQDNITRAPQGEPGAYPWVCVLASYADSCIVRIDGLAPDAEGEDEIVLRFPLAWDGEKVTLGTPTEVEFEISIIDAAADVAEDAAEAQGAPVGSTPADMRTAGATAESFDVHVLGLEESVAHVAGAITDDVKAGAVQARRNRDRLTTIATAVQAMLDEIPAEDATDGDKGAQGAVDDATALPEATGDAAADLVALMRAEIDAGIADARAVVGATS